jgi:hypothetical protein
MQPSRGEGSAASGGGQRAPLSHAECKVRAAAACHPKQARGQHAEKRGRGWALVREAGQSDTLSPFGNGGLGVPFASVWRLSWRPRARSQSLDFEPDALLLSQTATWQHKRNKRPTLLFGCLRQNLGSWFPAVARWLWARRPVVGRGGPSRPIRVAPALFKREANGSRIDVFTGENYCNSKLCRFCCHYMRNLLDRRPVVLLVVVAARTANTARTRLRRMQLLVDIDRADPHCAAPRTLEICSNTAVRPHTCNSRVGLRHYRISTVSKQNGLPPVGWMSPNGWTRWVEEGPTTRKWQCGLWRGKYGPAAGHLSC